MRPLVSANTLVRTQQPLPDKEPAKTTQLQAPAEAAGTRPGHIARIVVASLASGLGAALMLVLVVFPAAPEYVTTGLVMLAFTR